jgi:predicted nuclease of predicted toxin-antitoxin system
LNLFDFPLLADENIHPDVIQYLREQGNDVLSVYEAGLVGQSDTAVLRAARQSGRIVISHDSDFGTITLAQNEPFIGIIFLRPGHITPNFTIQTLKTLTERNIG